MKKNKLKIASVQFAVCEDKYENIEHFAEIIGDGVCDNADIISLPEMWNCPYKTELFPEFAEPEMGDTWLAMSTLAKKTGTYIVGGSIPERGENDKIYNTSYVFDPRGVQVCKHRKVHLFDIYAHGKQVFRESDTLTAGNDFMTFETPWCDMGLNICFDIRFPESARIPALKGAKVIFNPAAFNMTTGPAHWEIGFRQRAVENQVFMVGTSTARDERQGYISYGHSIITSPWGEIVMQMDEKEAVNVTEIDIDYVDEIRKKLPLLSTRRDDVYSLELTDSK